MSREDLKDQQEKGTAEAQELDESSSSDADRAQTEAKSQLAQLASPFAQVLTPADLIDLWDESDGFFDNLNDPSDFIEPEGSPTYQLSDQDLGYFKNTPDEPKRLSEQRDDTDSTVSVEEINSPHSVSSLEVDIPKTDQTKPTVKLFEQGHKPSLSKEQSNPEASVKTNIQVKPNFQQKTAVSLSQSSISPLQVNQPKAKSAQPSLNERFKRRNEVSPSKTQIIVVAGGKGGVGRSLLCANLAFALAHLSSCEIGLVDLDPLHGSLHTYLGLEPHIDLPGRSLRGGIKPSSEQVPKSKVVLTRASRPLCEPLSQESRDQALEIALELKHQWLIVDAGAYSDPFTLDLFVNADHSLIMYSPEPNGLEAGHLFLQRALYRQLVNRGDEASNLARSLLNADYEGLLTGPTTLARSLKHIHPQACKQLETSISEFKPKVIVNHCRTQTDRSTADEITSILKRKWRIYPEVLGTVSYHHIALQSLVERRPLAQAFPSSPIYLDIEKIARQIIKDRSSKQRSTSSSASSYLSNY